MLRWRRNPRESGLRGICALERGYTLYQDRVLRCATVNKGRDGGWYWVVGWESGIPKVNTASEPVATVKEARALAMAYVKKHLKS